MDHTKQRNIRLVVDDEQALYAPFTPEDEFSEPLNSYIQAKLAGYAHYQSLNMTVVSHEPLDEARFRSAISNWTRNEKALFRKEERNTILLLILMLIFGSIMLVLTISLEKKIVELKYSLMPIMGTIALNNAVTILIKDMPIISAKRWILKGMEKNTAITFEYDNDKKGSGLSANEGKQKA